MNKTVLLLALFFLSLSFTNKAQTPVIERIESFFQNAITYSEVYPREKVYLHFDNNSYYLGENLWFKAYLTTTENQYSPEPLSKVLYVELWNQYGQLIERQILRVEKGVACGQFELDKKTLPGYYEVRAYTRWMSNFGSENYFSRVFPFYAAAKDGEYKKELFNFQLDKTMKNRPQTKQKTLSINFYPEGGELVEDLPSQVAFEVESKKELYPVAEVTVYSATGDSIGYGRTLHNGMGCFSYCPGKKPGYVEVLHQDKSYRFDLPKAQPKGFCLSVRPQNQDSVTIGIKRNSSSPADTVGLFLSANGKLYQAMTLTMRGPLKMLRLSTQELPAGVAQVVLISSTGKPICQRMFFVNQQNAYLNIDAEASKDIYQPGEAVTINFQLQKPDSTPVETNFSLAVRDITNSDRALKTDNIRTNLLLSSELKGYIHQPEYYFQPDNSVRTTELDLLMLVHGWQKYDWTNLLGYDTFVPASMPETSLVLEGRLKTQFLGKTLRNTEVSILVQDSIIGISQTLTDSLGYFRFSTNNFNGRLPVVLQAKSGEKKKSCYFLFDRNFYPPLKEFNPKELLPSWDTVAAEDSLKLAKKEHEELMSKYGSSILLDEVVVKKRRKGLPPLEYDSSISAFFDVEQMVEDDLDKGKEYVSVTHLLEEQGNFTRDPQTHQLRYKGRASYLALNGQLCLHPVTISQVMRDVRNIKSIMICEGSGADKFLNDMLINSDETEMFTGTTTNDQITTQTDKGTGTDADANTGTGIDGEITKADMEKAMAMDVLPFDFVTTPPTAMKRGAYSLFFVTTDPDVDIRVTPQKSRGIRSTYVQGYSVPKQFYSPDYSTATELPPANDHRRTLYWNPNIQTDATGKATVQFFNAQNYTQLNINAEAITKEGETGCLNK